MIAIIHPNILEPYNNILDGGSSDKKSAKKRVKIKNAIYSKESDKFSSDFLPGDICNIGIIGGADGDITTLI